MSLAEFRGPGARHGYDEDSPGDFDVDVARYRGGRNGRIILLGDGTEVLTDSTDDSDMFDHSMDDDNDTTKKESSASSENDSTRNEREDTPGPRSEVEKEHEKHESVSQGPSTTIKGVADKP